MAQPSAYARAYDFTGYAPAELPEVGARIDAELDALAVIVGQVRTSLAAIQRDDTALKNQAVHPDSLSAATRALIVGGWELRGTWVTATAYAIGDVVLESGTAYVCAVAHTSGTFATDLAAVKWVEFYAVETVTPDGSVSVAKLAADTLLDDASAAAARVTLGAGAVGANLFVSATAAEARGYLGLSATGESLATAASAVAARTTLGAAATTDVAALAGATFTGPVGFGDGDHYLSLTGGNPVRVWASGDFDGYARSGNEYEITIGNTQRFLLSATRGRFTGNLDVAGAAGVSAVNLPHAAGYFTVAGAAVTGQRAFNVASITYVSTGVYDVAFTTAAANSTYIVLLSVQAAGVSTAFVPYYTNLATGGFRIGITDNNNDAAFDPAGVSFLVIPGA
jgi:hypothetical protein